MEFTFSPQLHYLVHEADGEYVAHCLDLDFVGSGTTKDEAVQELNDAVIGLVVYMLRHGAEASNIKQAPARYWVMFEDAKANGTEIKGIYVLDSRFVDSASVAFFVDIFRGFGGFCFDSGR